MLPAAIDLEIRIAYLPDRRPAGRARSASTAASATASTSTTPRRERGGWLDYVAGTAWALAEAGLPLTGLRGVIASTLPPNAGLSSSAAIELASAWAMLHDVGTDGRAVHPGADLPARRERLRRRPERPDGPVRRSRAAWPARRVLLDCRSLDWRPIPLPAGRRRSSSSTRARRATSTARPTTSGAASARRPSPALAARPTRASGACAT